MTDLVIRRAEAVIQQDPTDTPPRLQSTALFLAGHGTPRNRRSRVAIERQVDLLSKRRIFAGVHPAFMLEPPFITDCWQAARERDLLMVPFFISDGLHVQVDIPVLLGEGKTEEGDQT